MRRAAERFLAPAFLLSATSFGTSFEVNISGFGVSPEHILLLIYGPILFSRRFTNFGVCYLIIFTITIFVGLLGIIINGVLNLHYFSLATLSLMFPLFIRYFEHIPRPEPLVWFSIILVLVQCIFFRPWTLGVGWDDIVVPGFGHFQRLAILGFVSSSLALMLTPIALYLLYKTKTDIRNRCTNFMLALVLLATIALTFSRAALAVLLLSSIFIMDRRMLLVFLGIFLALIMLNLDSVDIILKGFAREGYEQSPRFLLWEQTLQNFFKRDWVFGEGLMNPPLDNTFLSLIVGSGIWGLGTLVVFCLITLLWIGWLRGVMQSDDLRFLILLIVGAFIGALSYDVFSQRKILFGYALVVGALVGSSLRSHLRR